MVIKLKKINRFYLNVMLFFLVFSGFINNIIKIGSSNIGSNLFDVFVCIGYVLAAINQVNKKLKITTDMIFSGIICVGSVCIGFVNSKSFGDLFSGIRNHILYVLLWWVVYSLIETDEIFDYFKRICKYSLFISGFAIVQSVFHQYLPDELLNIDGVAVFSIYGVANYRCNGLVGDMLSFGGFAIVTFIMSYMYFFVYKKSIGNRIKKFEFILLCLPIIACLFTFSRASIFGIVVVSVFTFLYVEKKLKKKIVVILIGFFCAIYVLLFTDIGTSVLERFTNQSLNNSSDEIRIERYTEAINEILENPILGVGMGSQIGNRERIVTDGYWLTCLLEMGFPLFVVYIVFFVFTALSAFLEMKKKSATFIFALIYFFSIMYFIIFSFINSAFEVRINLCIMMIIYGLFRKSCDFKGHIESNIVFRRILCMNQK